MRLRAAFRRTRWNGSADELATALAFNKPTEPNYSHVTKEPTSKLEAYGAVFRRLHAMHDTLSFKSSDLKEALRIVAATNKNWTLDPTGVATFVDTSAKRMMAMLRKVSQAKNNTLGDTHAQPL